MTPCHHRTLELLPASKKRLRCRRCHLTIAGDDLDDGYCPECFEKSGAKQYDFEELVLPGEGKARYRCVDCGIITGNP